MSRSYRSFIPFVSSITIPKNVNEVLLVDQNSTWELVLLLSWKGTTKCQWIYAIKLGPSGEVDILKTHLVVKGYTHIYDLDYGNTFSLVAKMTFRLFFAMEVIHHSPLYQLNIKNTFLDRRSLHGTIFWVCSLKGVWFVSFIAFYGLS